jgi:TonB family protein
MKYAVCLSLALLVAGETTAQDQLSAAKDLYASAAYEDALSALARVKDADLAQQVDQYRAFSLFALGRTAEAETVVESIIKRDPLAVPDARDASPRITALFAQVRKRLLPDLIRDGYRSARATMDAGDIAGAVPKLHQVSSMLEEAKSIGASNDALADMGVLVKGFLDLAKSMADRAAAEEAAAAIPPAPAEPVAAAIPTPSETFVNKPPLGIYTVLDTDVIGPIAIRQQMPTVPHSVARNISGRTSGILEITINEKGRVENAIMREPVNPTFDSVVMAAASSWQYRPATKGGTAVKYIKRIAVSVSAVAK